MSNDIPIRKYKCIPPGFGGTFRYSSEMSSIGIQDCETSLGITFRIDSVRVFCANMQINDKGETKPISEDEGTPLRREIYDRLTNLAQTEEWELNNPKFGHDALLVCYKILFEDTSGQVTKYPAWYMIQGFCDFFMDCKIKLRDMRGKLLRAYPEAYEDNLLPPEKRTRFNDVWKAMCGESHMLSNLFSNAKSEVNKTGFVVDGFYIPDHLFYLDTNGRAAHVHGSSIGNLARREYVAEQIITGDTASITKATKGKAPQVANWSFSV